jgi:hypothetical protein
MELAYIFLNFSLILRMVVITISIAAIGTLMVTQV